MSYQTALTINNVIQEIDSKRYLLPSIQREFVWGTGQIENWLSENYKDAGSLSSYKQRQLIPDIQPSFPNFPEFLEAREELIRKKLLNELGF